MAEDPMTDDTGKAGSAETEADRSIEIQHYRFQETYMIPPGVNYVEAIKALMRGSL